MEETSLYPPRRYRSNSDFDSVIEESSLNENDENDENSPRSRINAISGDVTNIRQSENQNINNNSNNSNNNNINNRNNNRNYNRNHNRSNNNNSIDTRIRHNYIRRGNNNNRGSYRGRVYSIQTNLSDRRNNTRRDNERLLNERSSNANNPQNSNNLSRNNINEAIHNNVINRNNIPNQNNITNENQKCIICQSDDDDLILSKICICWSSYVCSPCMENMSSRNIISCPICRRKLKYNLKSKTGTNIKNVSYILLPYFINLIVLVIIPVWFFSSFFFNKENTNLQQDYKNKNDNDVLTLLCTPTLFLIIILFNKIIIYPFNIILFKTTALYYNFPRETILPLDFRCNFSRLYMYALLSYEVLYLVICFLINKYRINSLYQYFLFNTILYTVPFLLMALCFIIIGIYNTVVRIQNKIEKYVAYNVQSVHMNTDISEEQEFLQRRTEFINSLENLDDLQDEEEDDIDMNTIEEEVLNEIYQLSNH